jgi:hypothetical protein
VIAFKGPVASLGNVFQRMKSHLDWPDWPI